MYVPRRDRKTNDEYLWNRVSPYMQAYYADDSKFRWQLRWILWRIDLALADAEGIVRRTPDGRPYTPANHRCHYERWPFLFHLHQRIELGWM